jgi:Tfp pilus assembly protein PilF
MTDNDTSASGGRAQGIELRLFLLLFLLVCVVFHSVVGGEFLVWDDDQEIFNNPHLDGLGWTQLHWMFTDMNYMFRYQPFSWLMWAVIKACFGLRPFYFHAAVLLFHAANAGLVFLLIRKVLLLARPAAGDDTQISICAALAAALWAVHPLRVETTAWAVVMVVVQALFFLLLSLLCYLRAGSEGSNRRGYWASLILLVVSLASYPIALGGLVIYVALDVYPLRRLSLDPGQWLATAARRVWLEKIPFAVVTLLFGWVNLHARAHAEGIPKPPTLAAFPATARVMQAFYVWAYHAWKPWLPFGLTPVRTELVSFRPFDPPFVLSAILVLGLTALLFWRRHRWPGIFLVWLCHLALLVPALGLTEHPHFAADRYSVTVNIGWAMLLAGLFLKLWPRARARLAISVVVAVLVGVLSVMSYRQAQIWRTNDRFFHELLARLPDRPELAGRRLNIKIRLATAYRDQGDLTNSALTLEKVLQERPDSAAAHNELGNTFTLAGDLDAARTNYTDAAQLDPNLSPAWNNLGVAYAQQGKLNDAAAMFNEALRRQPENQDALQNLARALTLEGKTNEAAASLKKLEEIANRPPAK